MPSLIPWSLKASCIYSSPSYLLSRDLVFFFIPCMNIDMNKSNGVDRLCRGVISKKLSLPKSGSSDNQFCCQVLPTLAPEVDHSWPDDKTQNGFTTLKGVPTINKTAPPLAGRQYGSFHRLIILPAFQKHNPGFSFPPSSTQTRSWPSFGDYLESFSKQIKINQFRPRPREYGNGRQNNAPYQQVVLHACKVRSLQHEVLPNRTLPLFLHMLQK